MPGGSDNIRITNASTLFVPFPIVNNFTSYGLAAEFDLNGNVLRSWHDPDGRVVQMITHIEKFGNKLYLGNFASDYLAVVDY